MGNVTHCHCHQLGQVSQVDLGRREKLGSLPSLPSLPGNVSLASTAVSSRVRLVMVTELPTKTSGGTCPSFLWSHQSPRRAHQQFCRFHLDPGLTIALSDPWTRGPVTPGLQGSAVSQLWGEVLPLHLLLVPRPGGWSPCLPARARPQAHSQKRRCCLGPLRLSREQLTASAGPAGCVPHTGTCS